MVSIDLTEGEKKTLFWASFLSLTAAGVGFVFRAMAPALWQAELNVLETEVGTLLGAGLWPIAVMMILFSFIVDKVGYKKSMMAAFTLQALSVILTFTAGGFNGLLVACLFAGLGHGIVEACINPLVASIYRDAKTKYMAILHAAWPAGIVIGGTIYMLFYKNVDTWGTAKTAWFFMLLPVLAYGVMFILAKRYPVDERVEAKVPYSEMLREFGGLGMFLAAMFISYEFYNQAHLFAGGQYSRLVASLITGIIGGVAFGFGLKSLGKWMFFFLCVLMVPLATAELATDAWIQNLMKPVLGANAGWALVFSAGIMMVLRFGVGIPLKFTGPLGLLLISSVFSIIGLFWLSTANGAAIFVAFVFYAIGQTFYWPAVLGFTAERFPKGGALTLNTVSAMGLLTVGIFGGPFLGAVQEHYNATAVMKEQAAVVQQLKDEGRTITVKGKENKIVQDKVLFGVSYTSVNAEAVLAQPEFPEESKEPVRASLQTTGRQTLRVAAVLPISMAIGFALIMLWFRANGGYKPINLAEEMAKEN